MGVGFECQKIGGKLRLSAYLYPIKAEVNGHILCNGKPGKFSAGVKAWLTGVDATVVAGHTFQLQTSKAP